jgi:O-acetyl-ADP-ribose deacetylase (regulator of RNase III)
MIKCKEGNILNFAEDCIAHGCNCQKTMGSGVARALRDKWPEIYRADETFPFSALNKLGKFSEAKLSNGKTCFNIYSQLDYRGRYEGRTDLDYVALEKGLESVFRTMKARGLKSIALPRIGCGLAGGNWTIVSEMIERMSDNFEIDAIIYIF